MLVVLPILNISSIVLYVKSCDNLFLLQVLKIIWEKADKADRVSNIQQNHCLFVVWKNSDPNCSILFLFLCSWVLRHWRTMTLSRPRKKFLLTTSSWKSRPNSWRKIMVNSGIRVYSWFVCLDASGHRFYLVLKSITNSTFAFNVHLRLSSSMGLYSKNCKIVKWLGD